MAETKPQKESSATPLELAQNRQATLPKETPSFIKEMLPSHISSGYWLGLPSDFCNKHVPDCNNEPELKMKMKLIENESRLETESMLLSRNNARKHCFSGGWKGFCQRHKLKEKDVLLFQLQNSNTFEIYIFKRSKGVANIAEAAKDMDHVAVTGKVVDGDKKLSIPMNQKLDHFMDTETTMEINPDDIPFLAKAADGDPIQSKLVKKKPMKKKHVKKPMKKKLVKKKPENDMHIKKPDDADNDDECETVFEYTVQCGKCHKWRLLESLEQLEVIRSEIIQNPFICNKIRNVSCDDPSDRSLNDPSRTWIIDKPGLPITPSGFIRTVELTSDSSKCQIVYQVQNEKEKIRSFSEMKKFLEEHPQYNGENGLLDFTFTAPMIM